MNQIEVREEKLLNEFSVGADEGHRWLSLRRLCWSIGLDPSIPINRQTTAEILITLPHPGPARASRKWRPDWKPEDQRWGLVSAVGP